MNEMEASRYREALDKTLDIEGEYRVFTGMDTSTLQRNLAQKKTHPPRTLP